MNEEEPNPRYARFFAVKWIFLFGDDRIASSITESSALKPCPCAILSGSDLRFDAPDSAIFSRLNELWSAPR